MKKQTTASVTKKANKSVKVNYAYVEPNIYKTGSSYRVRVGNNSEYVTSLKMARAAKKAFKNNMIVG